MSFCLLVQPVVFGLDAKDKDNVLAMRGASSASHTDGDKIQAIAVLEDMQQRLGDNLHIDTTLLRLRHEPRHLRYVYENKGEAIFCGDDISFHNFTDKEGSITRRVVVLYPMNPLRSDEVARRQLVQRILEGSKSSSSSVELIDLRAFEEQKMYLEGSGAIRLSHDGKFAYMSRSSRTNDEVFEVLCSEENLNIPAENRFVFTSTLSGSKHDEKRVVQHTNLLGWCGKGICAWGLECMQFASEKNRESFIRHVETEYKLALTLREDEVRAFAGNAKEIAFRTPEGKERRVLCLSETAFNGLQRINQRALQQWYGPDGLLVVYAEVLERRCGASVGSCLTVSQTHGDVLPKAGELTTLSVLGVTDHPDK